MMSVREGLLRERIAIPAGDKAPIHVQSTA